MDIGPKGHEHSEKPTAQALADRYRLLHGRELDAHWRAVFAVATCSEVIWLVFQPYLDLEQGRLVAEGLEQLAPALGRGEARIVGLALSLFRGQGCVDLAEMVQELDSIHWKGALEALKAFRSGFTNGEE